MRRNHVAALMILSFVVFSLCVSATAATKAGDRVKVFVSILPIAYFVERVGGPNVELDVLVGPGQDPHTLELTPRIVAKLADARVLYKLGFPFEETLVKKIGSTAKKIRVVSLQQGIRLRPMSEEEVEAEEAEHGHGHHEEAEHHAHSHGAGDMDPHTWVDPKLAKIQAQTIADTLIQVDPTHKSQYEENLKKFQADLDAVNEHLKKALAPVKGKSIFVFHPAYGYFGDEYGLKQVAVQMEGKEPTAKQLARLIDRAKKDGVKVIFVQPQFSKKSAEVLAKSIGGAVVSLDVLAPDYLKNLSEMADKIDAALGSQKK